METDLTEKHIDLVDIEKELGRLLQEEQGKKRTRACFFNLVIYAEKNEHCTKLVSLIDTVLSKFPCRVFYITNEKTPQEYLRTSVSTKSLPEGIFCEVINIAFGGALVERVPYILRPHILPDLPLYLLWTQDPTQEKIILPTLEPFARRIIFDPEATADLQKSCQNILAIMETLKREVGDLHWSALRGWRKIFASIFDSPENLDLLANAKSLTITYQQKNPRKAAYFQAWLASNLGWKLKSQEHGRLTYTKSGQQITVLLIPFEDPLEKNPLAEGTLLSVEIESAKKRAHLVFKRHSQTRQVFYQYSDQDRCNLPSCLFLGGVKEGQEIIDEIFYREKSPHYRKMLELLSNVQ